MSLTLALIPPAASTIGPSSGWTTESGPIPRTGGPSRAWRPATLSVLSRTRDATASSMPSGANSRVETKSVHFIPATRSISTPATR